MCVRLAKLYECALRERSTNISRYYTGALPIDKLPTINPDEQQRVEQRVTLHPSIPQAGELRE